MAERLSQRYQSPAIKFCIALNTSGQRNRQVNLSKPLHMTAVLSITLQLWFVPKACRQLAYSLQSSCVVDLAASRRLSGVATHLVVQRTCSRLIAAQSQQKGNLYCRAGLQKPLLAGLSAILLGVCMLHTPQVRSPAHQPCRVQLD